MQHWNLDFFPTGRIELPAVGPASVSPASTKIFVSLGSCGASCPPPESTAHSGLGTGFPDSVLSPATNPPPKSSTFVNVCVSPPRLFRSSIVPVATSNLRGLNLHASTARSSVSSSMNSAKVVSPSPTQVPGPTAALNEVGSQSSRILTVFVFVLDFVSVSDNATLPPVIRTVNARAAPMTTRTGVPRDACMIAPPAVSGGSGDRYQHRRYVAHGRGTTSAQPSLPAFLAVKEGIEKLSGDPSHGHNCPPGPDRLADGGTLGAKA